MKEFFIDNSVNAAAVCGFFNDSAAKNNEIHAVEIYVGGSLLVRAAASPYSCEHKREIYSLSKSFTSAAVGAMWDEGIIDLDEKIIDIFPDKVPCVISENLAQMTVRHCLTMTTGHEACVMETLYDSDDPVRAFLANEVKYKPGTYFMYNTGASCLLGLIVEKKTGRKLFDYTSEKILEPLGIEGAWWTECRAHMNEGGIGLHLSCDDISRFGLMLAAGGAYNGKRVLSEKWVEMAAAAQVDNSANGDSGTGNWTSGYGFQFWRTPRSGYRGDGLKGQLCMVIPEKNAVVSIVACTLDMESEITDAVQMVENLFKKENNIAQQEINDYLPLKAAAPLPWFVGKTVILEKNTMGLTSMRIDAAANGLAISLYNGTKCRKLNAGNGDWLESSLHIAGRVPKIQTFMNPYKHETLNMTASYLVKDGKITLCMRHLSDPHTETAEISADKNGLTVKFEVALIPEMIAEKSKQLNGFFA